MDYTNHNTSLRTNKHLSYEERFYIEKQLQANVSKSAIAKALGRSRTTIHTEIKRGTVVQIKQGTSVLMYLADRGQGSYEASRKGSFNTLKAGAIEAFLAWIESKIVKDRWSLDAAVGYAIRNHLFARGAMVSTKMLYNYVHQGILPIAPIDLPLMVRRSTRKARIRKHKKHLGKSIDLRDTSILRREEFGHWELDTVRGSKDKQDEVIVSLLECKTRAYVTLKSPSAKAADITTTLQNWLSRCSDVLDSKSLCKTITSDNGLEFASITDLENEGLQIFLLIPMPHRSEGLMKDTMDCCVVSFPKVFLYILCLKPLLNGQQIGVTRYPEKFLATVHHERHSLTKLES